MELFDSDTRIRVENNWNEPFYSWESLLSWVLHHIVANIAWGITSQTTSHLHRHYHKNIKFYIVLKLREIAISEL